MSIERRDTFKLAGVAVAAAVLPSIATASASKVAAKTSGKSVVIVGGGFWWTYNGESIEKER